jgi:methionyl-tRNA formyltransferase
MGTAPLARVSLEALLAASGLDVVAVVTQPDRPKGRDLRLAPSPVKEAAASRSLPVLQPERIRDPLALSRLAEFRPDLIVVAAYGQILPSAILDGAPETGVTIMKMDAGLDTGAMLAWERTPILPADDATSLHDRLAALGASLLVRTIPGYLTGTIQPQLQPAQGASYARKIAKDDGRMDWARPAHALWNQVRGLTPWPGAFSYAPTQAGLKLVKIWRAEPVPDRSGRPGEVLQADRSGLVVACGQGSLRLLELQREGGRRIPADAFLQGLPLAPGELWQPAAS